jgi:hypothetical protein
MCSGVIVTLSSSKVHRLSVDLRFCFTIRMTYGYIYDILVYIRYIQCMQVFTYGFWHP